MALRRYQGVTAYVGLPGSGKSYALAEVGVKALRAGRDVWCNEGFDLDGAQRFASFDEFLSVPNDAVVVWDELPLYVNSRKWAEFPDGLLYRLTQIRKDGLQLHYSTIDWRMVDINVRRITYWVWECHGLTSRLLLRRLYPPEERRRSGEGPRSTRFVWVSKDVGAAYDTFGKVAVNRPAVSSAREVERWGLVNGGGPGEAGPDPALAQRRTTTVNLSRLPAPPTVDASTIAPADSEID